MTAELSMVLSDLVEAIRAEIRAELMSSRDLPDRLLSVEEAASRLGIKRTALYSLIQSGELGSIRVGRRRLVAESTLGDFISSISETRDGAGR